jgi:hypothetical protein
MIVLM